MNAPDMMQMMARVDAVIGRNITAYRESAGLTVPSLAEAVILSEHTLSHYEAGTERVPAHTLVRLSAALKTPLASFLPSEWQRPKPARTSEKTGQWELDAGLP